MSRNTFDPMAALRAAPRSAPPPPLEQAAFETAHAAIAAARPKGVQAMLDATVQTWQAADHLFDQVRRTPAYALGTRPAACKRGCGWCCHQPIGAAAIEVLAMARALAERPQARDMLAQWRPGQPCAFLKDGACSVYDIRPLKCRAVWHVDVRHCMAHYAGLPVMGDTADPAFQAEPKLIYEGTLKGLALPLIRAGQDCPGLEMLPALQAVIDAPEAAAQAWIRGQDPFPASTRIDWFPRPKAPPGRTDRGRPPRRS